MCKCGRPLVNTNERDEDLEEDKDDARADAKKAVTWLVVSRKR